MTWDEQEHVRILERDIPPRPQPAPTHPPVRIGQTTVQSVTAAGLLEFSIWGASPGVTMTADEEAARPVVFTRQDLVDQQAAERAALRAEREARAAEKAEEIRAVRTLAVALTLTGQSVAEIAATLQVPASLVRTALKTARLDGTLVDTVQTLTAEALPLALEKLIEKLEAGEKWAIQETLHGLGAFRRYGAVDESTAVDARQLAVTFVMPAAPQPLNEKGIVGVSRGVSRGALVGEAVGEAVGTREATHA